MLRRLPILAGALAVATLAATAAAQDQPAPELPAGCGGGGPALFWGVAPDASVRAWIKYRHFGPKTALPPIVSIAAQSFETCPLANEHLIVVSQARYDVVAAFTRARRADSDCARWRELPARRWGVEISEHDGRTRSCYLLGGASCRYLFDLLDLPDMEWTTEERRPIEELARYDEPCRKLAPARFISSP